MKRSPRHVTWRSQKIALPKVDPFAAWFRRQLHQLSDGASFERSIGDAAGMLIAIAQQPGLPDRPVVRQRRFEPVRQTSPAPKPVLVDRRETQRVQYRRMPSRNNQRRNRYRPNQREKS